MFLLRSVHLCLASSSLIQLQCLNRQHNIELPSLCVCEESYNYTADTFRELTSDTSPKTCVISDVCGCIIIISTAIYLQGFDGGRTTSCLCYVTQQALFQYCVISQCTSIASG